MKLLTPSYRVLPEASILEKLKAFNPTAPQEIMDSFEKIAEDRCAEESKKSIAFSLTASFKRAFTDGLFYYFRPLTNLRDTFEKKTSNPLHAASAAIARNWAVTGDDLRAAINAYMQEREITPQQIGLNQKEIESLRYVAKKHTPGCQRPPAP